MRANGGQVERQQHLLDAVRLARKQAVAQRPAGRPLRLQREQPVGCQQERILLHRDERRQKAVEPCEGGVRHILVPARHQLLARLRRKQSRAMRREELERLLEIARRLAEARADRFRLRLQRLEVVPFQKNAPLPGHPGRQLAQNAAVGNVSERVEIRLHAVARAQDERARREEQDAAEQKPNAYEPVRFQGDPRW